MEKKKTTFPRGTEQLPDLGLLVLAIGTTEGVVKNVPPPPVKCSLLVCKVLGLNIFTALGVFTLKHIHN